MPLVPPYIASLDPYRPGKPISELKRESGVSRVIKLASNENPHGPSPKAVEAIRKGCSDLHLYPNGGRDLREVLASQFRLKLENVIAGSGSEGIMSNIIRTFLCDDDEVLTSEGTFVGIYVLVRSRGVKLVTVPMRDYRYDLSGIAASITPKTKIIYLANPNNPTGTIFTKAEFDRFMSSVPSHVLIILDEAYFDYANDSPDYPDSMMYRYDNVITLRTFSKAYGLAGIRIGYGFAHEELISNLLKVKLPFEPSSLAQTSAIAALEDRDFLQKTLETNRVGMSLVTLELSHMGYRIPPSRANFVMIPLESEHDAMSMYAGLLRRGIIVRPLQQFGLPCCLRVTIGTHEENNELIAAMHHLHVGAPSAE